MVEFEVNLWERVELLENVEIEVREFYFWVNKEE